MILPCHAIRLRGESCPTLLPVVKRSAQRLQSHDASDDFVKILRSLGQSENFPIVTHSLSAPMVAIMGLHSVVRKDRGKPVVGIFQYPWFTVMAFFNEHHDLRLIRSLQHRGIRRPSNFRHALATTNASLEFVEPDLYVVPLGAEVDQKIPEDLERSFPDSLVETVVYPVSGAVVPWAPEAVLAIQELPEETAELQPYLSAFCEKRSGFYRTISPPQRKTIELYPSRTEMSCCGFLSWVGSRFSLWRFLAWPGSHLASSL